MTIPLAANHRPLAYQNDDFLESDEARPMRILAEYLEPMASLRREKILDTVVFFGSARLSPEGPLRRYYEEGRELARLVTQLGENRLTRRAPVHRLFGGWRGHHGGGQSRSVRGWRKDHRPQYRPAAPTGA